MISVVDVNVSQSCVFPRPSRPTRAPRAIGPIEAGWREGKTFFKHPVVEHQRPTVGTAKPHPLQGFLSRVAELTFLRDTQALELETVAQELARTGLASSSLDASHGDDEDGPSLAEAIAEPVERTGLLPIRPTDVTPDPEVERDARRYGTPYVRLDPALERRIEWERYMLSCSMPERIAWDVTRDGSLIAVHKSQLTPRLAKNLQTVRQGRTAQQIINDRERATFYGGVGSLLYGVARGAHPEASEVNDLVAEIEEAEDGPKELRFASDESVNEPAEDELWPVTLEEVALAIVRGVTLSAPERRWLASHEEDLPRLLPPALATARERLAGLSD